MGETRSLCAGDNDTASRELLRARVKTRRFLARPGHIFRVAAAVLANALRRQFQHSIRERRQEVAIVRNEQHGLLEPRERRDQHLLRRHVDMVGRFVEHQEVGSPEPPRTPC